MEIDVTKRTALVVCAFAALLAVSVGCGGSELIDPTAGTQMSLAASPDAALAGSPVTFTVTAQTSGTIVTSASIDFENDGAWDEVQIFDQSSITATFTHVYDDAGGFTVRAQVRDANDAATSKTLIVIVSAPLNPPVSYRLNAESSVGDRGVCEAFGPPAACAGCSVPIASTGIAGSVGSFPHGTPLSLTQAFDQLRFVTGTANLRYSCGFSADLYAGTPGNEVQFAHGACSTNSGDLPERLTCAVTTSGVVP